MRIPRFAAGVEGLAFALTKALAGRMIRHHKIGAAQ